MRSNDDETAFCRIRNLGVHRIAPTYLGRLRAIGEDVFDGMMARAAAKLHKADRGQLMESKGRVVGFEVDDQLTHRDGQGPMMIGALRPCGAKEAHHAFTIKRIGRASERTDRRANFLRTFLDGCAK